VPLETPARIVKQLARQGYNAEREAVTLLADEPDSDAALERALETLPDDALKLTTDHVRESIETEGREEDGSEIPDGDRSTRDADAVVEDNPQLRLETAADRRVTAVAILHLKRRGLAARFRLRLRPRPRTGRPRRSAGTPTRRSGRSLSRTI